MICTYTYPSGDNFKNIFGGFMKGFITYYVKIKVAEGMTLEDAIAQSVSFIKQHNKDVIETIKNSGFEMMFIPTYEESSHLEKTILEAI